MKNINLEIVYKDTKVYTFRAKNATTGLPYPVNGITIYFTVKSNFNDADSSAKLAKSYLIPTDTDSLNGIAYLSLTESDTTIDVGEYYYDMKFVKPGMRSTIIRGRLSIIPSIKKA